MQLHIHNTLAGTQQLQSLEQATLRIGRAAPGEQDPEICLKSRLVSRRHAVLRRDANGAWFVEATGANDTLLNEQPLPQGRPSPVQPGDQIRIGEFILALTQETPTEAILTRDSDIDLLMDLEQTVHAQLLEKMDLRNGRETLDPQDPETHGQIMQFLDELLEDAASALDPETLDRLARLAVYRRINRRIAGAGGESSVGPSEDGSAARNPYEIPYVSIENRITHSLGIAFEAKGLEQDSNRLDQGFQRTIGQYDLEFSAGLRVYLVESLIRRDVLDLVLGFGPLQELLEMDSISEIMVVSREQIFIEKFGIVEDARRSFFSDDMLLAVIERIVSPLGRRIDRSTPLVDARLPDGSRVNAIIPPLAVKGPCLTIRKFSKVPLEIEDLIRFGALTAEMNVFLRACVQAHTNIIVSGGTGSGKTTLLNCLSRHIPPKERIVTIEDTVELQLKQKHVVTLESRPPNMEGKGAITIQDLVKNSLRMRPDRVVVGECRGPEALDMLQAMNTGHDGSMTTGHANNPQDMMLRLETMVLMGTNMPVAAIRDQIKAAIHVVVQLSRFSDGSRRITHISEVCGIDEDLGTVMLNDIFIYRPGKGGDAAKGRFIQTGYLPSFTEKLLDQGVMTLDDFF